MMSDNLQEIEKRASTKSYNSTANMMEQSSSGSTAADQQPNPQVILRFTVPEHHHVVEQHLDDDDIDHDNLIEQDEDDGMDQNIIDETADDALDEYGGGGGNSPAAHLHYSSSTGPNHNSNRGDGGGGGGGGGGPADPLHKYKPKNYILQIPQNNNGTEPKGVGSAASLFNNNNNTIKSNAASTTSNNNSSNSHHQYNSFIGRLVSKDNILLISQNVIEIGRNSSKSSVDFHVGKNSFVSRKHLIVHYDGDDFNLICASKNGVFIDGTFQRKSVEPYKLPSSCTLRFPSTNIRIQFENLVGQKGDLAAVKHGNMMSSVENTEVVYQPLKITIPEQDGHPRKSPFPSPTGTISAANSCPTSPRQGYHDFYSMSKSITNSHNNNNNSNSNHDNYTEFPPPSTSASLETEKPPYSYAQLIVQSISASPDKQLTLSGIYSYISKNYPYYRTGANKGWQNSIRHNLSLNRYFIKVPRSQDEPGKGSFWRIDPSSEIKLIDQSYRKRRQRGSQGFRTPFGMPRSAPASPNLVDNSRDSSPLNDVILQSAPGSPGSNNYSTYESNQTYINSQNQSFTSPNSKRTRDADIYDDSYDCSDSDEYESTVKRQKI